MKIVLDKNTILDGLQKVQSVINPRSPSPVLANVLINAHDDLVTLFATDIDVSIRIDLPAQVKESGVTTLHARRMAGIFRELPAAEIEMDVDEEDIASVRSGGFFTKLVGMSEDEFPPIPSFEGGKKFTMDQGVFKEMLQKTMYAASTDDSRPILNGVLVSLRDEKITVVATDGRRLALVEQELEFPKDDEMAFVLPSKTVVELTHTLAETGELTIQALNNQIIFHTGGMILATKILEGQYPNFRQVIPAHTEYRITIEREALLTAVRRVAILAKEQDTTVRLCFDANRLEISTEAQDIGEARESLPIKHEGQTIDVAFNPDFLMDPLKNLESDEVYLELSDSLSPGIIKSNVPFLYVIMPMRIS